ncbi:fasciclin domain-containing protein [Piscinibacter aquaticus]|uniref:Fasciclin domain-containing protein n=1 Tax=Piscinibacter aquaticus TaxID=392597 RepID=A0A5C6U3B5_9BURK|nr:fasciclin domain-containing protein [Piscinibacter aquaticus]
MKNILAIATLSAAALLQGCASTPAPATITDTAARTPQLSTLNKLIAEAGLADTLRQSGPYTVFAPSDDAFKAVPAKTLAELAANKELLKSVLTYHVLPGKVGSAEMKNGNAKTVQGANLALARAGGFVTVEDAMVTQADVPASNGVVHVIDRVLMPPKK